MNHDVEQEFVLVLRKMSMNEPKYPLEMVFGLGNSKKYPSVIKFILEKEDITRKIYSIEIIPIKI